jgi:hypothetical protein
LIQLRDTFFSAECYTTGGSLPHFGFVAGGAGAAKFDDSHFLISFGAVSPAVVSYFNPLIVRGESVFGGVSGSMSSGRPSFSLHH